jgi:hypothetical protein
MADHTSKESYLLWGGGGKKKKKKKKLNKRPGLNTGAVESLLNELKEGSSY